MARQLDLTTPPTLRVEPAAGNREPRLWVRRLVLWSEPGVVLRDIWLRPGLNIVWSPDPSDRPTGKETAEALGHGSGKTLLCRLLRYCLGEERFAPDGQRDSIALALPAGLVGAEAVVDGTTWAVVRSIGGGRRHAAVPDADLDALAARDTSDPRGIAAFLEAVETRIISEQVAALIPGERDLRAWPIALAWLARDQECRFDDVLDWRSTSSDSGSPARGLSATRTLDALRAFLGAIDPAEHALRDDIAQLEHARNEGEREAAHREWRVKQETVRLAQILQLRSDEVPSGPLAVEVFRSAARTHLAHEVQPDAGRGGAELDALRAEYESARSHFVALQQELAEVEARLPVIQQLVSRIAGESSGISFSLHQSEHPVCPVCEVPIDRALAEGCKLSHKLPDREEIRMRKEQHQRDLEAERRLLNEQRGRISRLAPELAEARRLADELYQRLKAVEGARDRRHDAWYSARRLLDDVAHLDELYSAEDKAAARVRELDTAIDRKRERVASLRDASARTFRRVSENFDAIVVDLAGPLARGRISLDGNGLHLVIDMGGVRSTAAIDSLKVLAFDLAALCMSIEGTTHVPAFLIHDSPREADLGLSAYHRLFHFARSLEEIGERPLFQYIVTTTTGPPDEFRAEPWLRLTLEGAPADRRLLRRDL